MKTVMITRVEANLFRDKVAVSEKTRAEYQNGLGLSEYGEPISFYTIGEEIVLFPKTNNNRYKLTPKKLREVFGKDSRIIAHANDMCCTGINGRPILLDKADNIIYYSSAYTAASDFFRIDLTSEASENINITNWIDAWFRIEAYIAALETKGFGPMSNIDPKEFTGLFENRYVRDFYCRKTGLNELSRLIHLKSKIFKL